MTSFGFTTMNTAADVRPETLGRALVERGFESLWIGEHSHIPVSRQTPYPAGGEMPEPYKHMMDPFLSLLAAAQAAPTLHVGIGVALVLEHHLLELAKRVATLDLLTEGRMLFGVGVGWNVEELANHRPDIAWSRRYRAVEEGVAALRQLWTAEEAEFHGEFFDFDPVWSYPKPMQQPHPPVLFGGSGPMAFDHALRWADGWMPMDAALGNVPRRIARFREAVVAAGRAPVPITLVTFGDPTVELLAAYRELGLERVVIGAARTGWDDPTTTMTALDHYAEMLIALGD